MIRTLLCLACVGSLAQAPASGDTLFVKADLTTGASDGTSWADAFQGEAGLEAALAARGPADEIWVAAGRYRPSVEFRDGRPTFLMTGRVVIFGGFAGGEATLGERPARGLALTVLDGDISGDDAAPGGSKDDNCRHVVSMEGVRGHVERLTVRAGHAWSPPGSALMGGGIFIELLSGGLCVQDVDVIGNEAQVYGAGISLRAGWDTHTLRFVDCLFEANRTGTFAGGMYVSSALDLRLEGCEFRSNSAGGAGAILMNSGVNAWLTNCVFFDNEARAPNGGGAITASGGSTKRLDNCTLYGNRALASPYGGILSANGALVLNNCILWGNVGNSGSTVVENQLTQQSGVSYSHVQGWAFGGSGNSSADPMLTDPNAGDYAPLAGSPVIDAGGAVDPADRRIRDFLGKRRRVDDPVVPDTGVGPMPVLDIGAVERSVGAIGTMVCDGGINSSGRRGAIDAFGSTAAADNSVMLVASGLPPQQFGIFIVSRDAGHSLSPSGVKLCLRGAISRIAGPGQILDSAANGEFSLMLDLTAIPSQSGLATVTAGQSWSFEGWHRDSAAFGSLGFTDTTTIEFR